MRKSGINLTPLETKVLAWGELLDKRVIHTGDIASYFSLSAKQESDLLTKMSSSGAIVRLIKGLYLLPTGIPSNKWTPSEYFLLATLMKELGASYQVTGLAALNYHGFSSQIPNQISIYNSYFSGEKTINNISFDFIKTKESRLIDSALFQANSYPDTVTVAISSLVKTLFDAVYDYKRFATIPEVYSWIKEKSSDKKLIKDLVSLTIKLGNISTRRRIGFILESIDTDTKLTNKIHKTLTQTNSLIPIIPNLPIRGENNKKWGVVLNGTI